ncbi:hypothetical protein BGW80DRAFT_1349130 [Lactifluus volemus]|nr:hypothetical protein BGW80DRAFT_1349130 [Lactifluus volemus]
MLGIANSTRPVFRTAIRLLNGTRLHRHSFCTSPRFRAARERILKQASPMLSPNISSG